MKGKLAKLLRRYSKATGLEYELVKKSFLMGDKIQRSKDALEIKNTIELYEMDHGIIE